MGKMSVSRSSAKGSAISKGGVKSLSMKSMAKSSPMGVTIGVGTGSRSGIGKPSVNKPKY